MNYYSGKNECTIGIRVNIDESQKSNIAPPKRIQTLGL